MTFDWRIFLKVWLFASPTSFVTFIAVQFMQGQVDDLLRTATRAAVVGLGLALLFSLQRKRKDYPWL